MTTNISAAEAYRRLRAGNRRFSSKLRTSGVAMTTQDFEKLAAGQKPFAIILGCSDSRVPAELIFDQGIGDLFVIRVAGNIVAPSQVGSIEYAALAFQTQLVVVLGHSHCGAVTATIDTMMKPDADSVPGSVSSIVDRIKPVVNSLLETNLREDREALREAAIRANVRTSVDQLRHGSSVIESLIKNHGLQVIGAEYSLLTGEVDFFDGVPREWEQE